MSDKMILSNSTPIFPEPWGSILAILGIVVLVLTFLELLSNLLPKMNRAKTWAYGQLSEHFKFKSLEKRAIACDIEGAINETTVNLLDELPLGWVHMTKLNWVKGQNSGLLEDGEMILRMQPRKSQDSNLINGIYYYFLHSIFPKTREIIPEAILKSSGLQISRRTISEYKKFLLDRFDGEILETEIKLDGEISNYFEHFQKLDKKGFFTSSFLREIDFMANKVRFSEKRQVFSAEARSIMDHMNNFIDGLPNAADNLWTKKDEVSSYRFLLAKNPYKFKYKIYVNRAKMSFRDGIENLYVLGSTRDEKFVKQVIKEIKKLREVQLVELFKLGRDFRGKKGGIGALFTRKKET